MHLREQNSAACCRILGIAFHAGTAEIAVRRLSDRGGLLVAPAAPALLKLMYDPHYRKALLRADVVLADSGFMVLAWKFLAERTLPRISGLTYLRALLREPQIGISENTFWVMASRNSACRNLRWLERRGIQVPETHVYIAPQYGAVVEDPHLLEELELRRVRHVIVTLGGGVQEVLGDYLNQHLTYKPAIHCIGAAMAMLSGDQVRIPCWVDRTYLGWLLRCASDPLRFVPRYSSALRLFSLLRRYGDQLPPLLGRALEPALQNPTVTSHEVQLP